MIPEAELLSLLETAQGGLAVRDGSGLRGAERTTWPTDTQGTTTASKCTASVSIREGARPATARPGRRNDNSRMQPIVIERPGVEEEPADPDPPSPDSGDLASRIATVKLPSSRYRPTASRRCLTFSPFQPGEAGVHTVADSGYSWSAFSSGAGGRDCDTGRYRRLSRAQKQVNTAHPRMCGPGERGNAQLKSWRILRKIRCCPTRATSWSTPSRYSSSLAEPKWKGL